LDRNQNCRRTLISISLLQRGSDEMRVFAVIRETLLFK
jgi:hypothetical protein